MLCIVVGKNYTPYFKIQRRCIVSNVKRKLFTNYIHNCMVSNVQTELFTNDIPIINLTLKQGSKKRHDFKCAKKFIHELLEKIINPTLKQGSKTSPTFKCANKIFSKPYPWLLNFFINNTLKK